MTDEQWLMITRLEQGMVWFWHRDQKTDDILRYLMSKGICEAREDIRENWLQLSQDGRILLHEHIEILAAEKKKLEQQREEIAREKTEKKKERRFQLFNTLLGAGAGALLALFVEHLSEILVFFKGISQSG